MSIPETWSGFTQALIKRSKAERTSQVHCAIDNLLTQAANEAWAAWNNSNNGIIFHSEN